MIRDFFIGAFSNISLPPEVSTMLLGFLPIIEMRGAVPAAHGLFKLSWFSAFFWAYLGSMLPAAIILKLADPVIAWCNRKSRFCANLVGRALERTRKHFRKEHEKFGELALLIFVAIPLPGTGVWAGSLAAVIFGISFRRAMALIAAGNAVAGVLITLASAGAFSLVGALL